MAMKKAQFFSLDAFLALSIFVIAITLLYSFYTGTTPQYQQYYYADDLANLFSTIKMNELDIKDKLGDYGLTLAEDGDKTINEAIRKLQISGDTTNAKKLVSYLIGNLLPEKYGIEFNLNEESIYTNVPNAQPEKTIARSKYIRGT